MTNRNKYAFRVFFGIILAASVVFTVLGEKMNQNQLLGCLSLWAFLVIWAGFMWWVGTLPILARLATEPNLRLSFAIGTGALIFAIVQVPLWGLMTNRFPPDNFTSLQGTMATIGILFGAFAPAGPMFLRVMKGVWELNQEQHRKLKEKKN